MRGSSFENTQVLNQERDGLKHPTPDRPQQITIEWHDAAFMIARGASKLEAWTPKMVQFKTWYLARLNELDHSGRSAGSR
jgi:hypothetical protein